MSAASYQYFVYLNIPFFPDSASYNTEMIALYMLFNLLNSPLYENIRKIYYVYVGGSGDMFESILRKMPFYSKMVLLGTYPNAPSNDTSILMTCLYKNCIQNYACFSYNMFINLYEIVSIYSNVSSLNSIDLVYQPSTSPTTYRDILSQFLSGLFKETDCNSNISTIQINWMDYLIYFYMTHYTLLIGQLSSSNVVGIDLIKQSNKCSYLANIWWTFSNYIQTLPYIDGRCTSDITNGNIGGLYRSVWSSYIKWRNINAPVDAASIPPELIALFYPNIATLTGMTYESANYELQYKESIQFYILNIINHSILSGYFYIIPECFKPIHPIFNSIYEVQPRYNLIFGFSKNIQYGQSNPKPINTKETIKYCVSPPCMTRQNLSYINPKISQYEHKRRLLIWNKKKPNATQR